jgi:tetratricopeptide (TPR) repeat protein
MMSFGKCFMCAVSALWFFLVMEIVLTPAVASLMHSQARILAARGRYSAASELYCKAMSLEPSNASYQAAYAEFLVGTSGDNGRIQLEIAHELYSLALDYCPRSAEYHYRHSLVLLRLAEAMFAGRGVTSLAPYVHGAVDGIRQSVVADPNGFNTAFRTGTLSLILWRALDEDDKILFLGRLRSVIRQRPWYAESHIYPLIMRYAGDPGLAILVTLDSGEALETLRRFLDKCGDLNLLDEKDIKAHHVRLKLSPESFYD